MTIETISQFFAMGGYAFYVWCAYGSVFVLLGLQWFIPWRRWAKYLYEHHS
jgi:heme exporter protein D